MKLSLHKKSSNQEISEAFQFIGDVLSLQPGTIFRVRAYQNAASVIEQLPKPLHDMFLNDAGFKKIPGIGDTLQQKLTELFTTGNIKAFDEYTEKIPESVWPLWQIHGIGIKKAHKLVTQFGLENALTALADMTALAEQGKIRDLPGFGEKSEQDILTAIKNHALSDRIPFKEANAIAQDLVADLRQSPSITQVEVLGSLRRKLTTVGDIDLGIATPDMAVASAYIQQLPKVKRVAVSGPQLLRVFLTTGQQVDIKVSTPQEWGAFLQHFSGSKEHNIRLRELALKQGKSLSEHGSKENGELKTFATEKDFYKYLGLNWIEPEKRIGGEEINQAKIT